jgi:hypothetical protein
MIIAMAGDDTLMNPTNTSVDGAKDTRIDTPSDSNQDPETSPPVHGFSTPGARAKRLLDVPYDKDLEGPIKKMDNWNTTREVFFPRYSIPFGPDPADPETWVYWEAMDGQIAHPNLPDNEKIDHHARLVYLPDERWNVVMPGWWEKRDELHQTDPKMTRWVELRNGRIANIRRIIKEAEAKKPGTNYYFLTLL